jgi:hypothetical protein
MATVGAGLDSGRRRKHMIDSLVDEYVRWREACVAVTRAYDTWVIAPPPDNPMAFAAYVAALDQEERAAIVYRERLEQAIAR